MIYQKYCSKCRKETLNRIMKISRTRGIKLQCLECQTISLRYHNVKKLKEVRFEKQK